MIADRLKLATRRAPDAKDAEATGWTFQSEGVGSWGELHAEPKLDVGTRVELHLKQGAFDNPMDWYGHLRRYLLQTVVYAPCKFQINTVLPGCEPVAVGPGWIAQLVS